MKQLEGIVKSNKMKKTVVVEVTRIKMHPKYKRRYKVSKRYKVQDSENQYRIGDKVIIRETRPLSKEKCWEVKGFVHKGKPEA